MIGLGAMLHELGGGSDEDPKKYYGRKIKTAVFDRDDNCLRLFFEDGIGIKIWDDGQSCCETRYMTCDDTVSDLEGKEFKSIKVKNVDCELGEDEYGEHELAFLEISAGDETITLATHNVHNGYYGGFGLSVTEIK